MTERPAPTHVALPSDLFADPGELASLVQRFSETKIAVVGDFFLDRYLVIDPALDEPSLETGLAARQIVAIRNSPGAAGTVVNNLVALGAKSLFAVGTVGDDAYGFELLRELQRRGVDTRFLVAVADRFTPTYTKPVLLRPDGEVELERLDIINRSPTPHVHGERVLADLESIAPLVDVVIVLDQVLAPDVGVITREVRAGLSAIASRFPETAFYADSRGFVGEFASMLTKPNCRESARALGWDDVESLPLDKASEAGRLLMNRTNMPVLLTMGATGILVSESRGQTLVPGVRVEGPIDVTGAGDSATAGIVLALASGASLPQSAWVGNLVASITVQQLRTTGTASPAQVIARAEPFLREPAG